ncbi:MAG: hypothetical protein GXP49_09735 [Deltaproteobacteria bacterium]|nr:hypothetical protein [Deltaproteobacteria bacterium]
MNKALSRALVLFAVTMIVVPGCAFLSGAGNGGDDEDVLSVFAIDDFHGQLTPGELDGRKVGGAAWIAGYLETLRKVNPGGVIAVDTGDAFTGPLVSSHTEGAVIIDFYNMLGFDAMAIGNHEFDYGPVGPLNRVMDGKGDPRGALKERAKQAKFPLLAANIFDATTGKRFAPEGMAPYTIIERKGVKIALIGLITSDLPKITMPYNLKGLMYKHNSEVLAELLPEVRKKGATVVILLAHLGGRFDHEAGEFVGEIADLARSLDPSEVDLIIGGHTEGAISGEINDIPVVKPEGYGHSFARVDLTVNKKNGRVVRSKTVVHPVTRFWHDGNYMGLKVKPDENVTKSLAHYFKAVDKLKAVEIGEATAPIKKEGTYNSPLGNLVTDAMRLFDDSIEVAVFNSGGIRADLPAGKLTFGTLFDALPFDNTLCIARLSGDQLRQMLEHALTGDFGNLEISGIKVTVDPAQPVGSRVIEIIGPKGKPVKEGDYLEVAVNDFLLAGGDGYNMIPRSTAVETGADIRELIVKLIDLRGKKISPDTTPRYEVTHNAS